MINVSRNGSLLCSVFVVAPILLLGVGCADLTGQWNSYAIEPEMARDQILLLRPRGYRGEFVRASFDFREDETYSAQVYYIGDMGYSDGGWRLLGDRLRLIDNRFGTETYRVEFNLRGDEMAIVLPIKGTDVRVRLRRKDAIRVLDNLKLNSD